METNSILLKAITGNFENPLNPTAVIWQCSGASALSFDTEMEELTFDGMIAQIPHILVEHSRM